MKSAKWDDDVTDFSLSCVTNTSTMHSSCILRILTKKDLELFKQRLNAVPAFAWYPCFIAAILIEMRLQDLPAQTSKLRRCLYKNEKTTGTHKSYQHGHHGSKWKTRTMEERWNDINFGDAPAELTSIASDCVYYESACSSRRRLIRWLDILRQAHLSAGHMQAEDITSRMLEQKLKFMEMWATETENRMMYLGKRAGIQLQMVSSLAPREIYPRSLEETLLTILQCSSLMAQRDNALNKETADSSLDVSKNTMRDSTYMRTIAFVTLGFLPGTFMAVCNYALHHELFDTDSDRRCSVLDFSTFAVMGQSYRIGSGYTAFSQSC